MKARRVKGLKPAAPLADNAERIVRERLSELCDFMPRAADPDEVEALHDMRIAAKRLRYVLEVTAPCFGPYAASATRLAKEMQDLLGEIHDCDEMLPRVRAHLDAVLASDASALRERAGAKKDLDARLIARAPSLDAYSGLSALLAYLQARRELLFRRFLGVWTRNQRDGFRARLEFAVSERSEPPPEVAPAGAEPTPIRAARRAERATDPAPAAKPKPRAGPPQQPEPPTVLPLPTPRGRTASRRPARRTVPSRRAPRPSELPTDGGAKDPSSGSEPPSEQG